MQPPPCLQKLVMVNLVHAIPSSSYQRSRSAFQQPVPQWALASKGNHGNEKTVTAATVDGKMDGSVVVSRMHCK